MFVARASPCEEVITNVIYGSHKSAHFNKKTFLTCKLGIIKGLVSKLNENNKVI